MPHDGSVASASVPVPLLRTKVRRPTPVKWYTTSVAPQWGAVVVHRWVMYRHENPARRPVLRENLSQS